MTDAHRPDDPRDLAAAYALGALDPAEAGAFEAALADDAAVARDVAEYREVAALLALAESARAPTRLALRERVRATVPSAEPARVLPLRRDGAPAARAPRRLALLPWAAAAAALLVAGWFGRDRAALQRTVAELQAALDDRGTRLAARERTLNAILEPGVELYQLAAADGRTGPVVQIFWDRRRNRAIVHSFAVPELPAGRAYQLWFIRDGVPVPSVTFRPEAGGHAKLEDVVVPEGGLALAAITEEPEGGSAAPTTPILLVGSLETPRGAARPGA